MEAVSVVKSQEISGAGVILGSNIINSDQNQRTVPKQARGDPGKAQQAEQKEKIEHIALAMDNYVKSIQTDLKIQVHNGTGNVMVKVLSKEDGRIIREIPPEELLNLAAKMEEMMGVLFNGNV